MRCENCRKQPATVHVTDVVTEDEKREQHLCEKCAVELGVVAKNYTISELLANLAGSQLAERAAETPDVKCPSCGMTFAQFRSVGRLGCADDYDVFGSAIRAQLAGYHDATEHVGKSPPGGPGQLKRASYLCGLRAKLGRAVEEEAYERAASLRDEIMKAEVASSAPAAGAPTAALAGNVQGGKPKKTAKKKTAKKKSPKKSNKRPPKKKPS